jgi:hypothetical protein
MEIQIIRKNEDVDLSLIEIKDKYIIELNGEEYNVTSHHNDTFTNNCLYNHTPNILHINNINIVYNELFNIQYVDCKNENKHYGVFPIISYIQYLTINDRININKININKINSTNSSFEKNNYNYNNLKQIYAYTYVEFINNSYNMEHLLNIDINNKSKIDKNNLKLILL